MVVAPEAVPLQVAGGVLLGAGYAAIVATVSTGTQLLGRWSPGLRRLGIGRGQGDDGELDLLYNGDLDRG